MAAEPTNNIPKQIFDGFMLSDMSLYPNGHAQIDLSGAEHIDWLHVAREMFESRGIKVCTDHPKITDAISKGRPYKRLTLATHVSPILVAEYNRWYKNGIKTVPGDLRLTSLTIAHWFMGDGCSSYKHQKDAPLSEFVSVSLSTDKFTEQEVDLLVIALQIHGISKARKSKAHSFFEIYISEANNVVKFMNDIFQYVLPSYSYKIKVPTLVNRNLKEVYHGTGSNTSVWLP